MCRAHSLPEALSGPDGPARSRSRGGSDERPATQVPARRVAMPTSWYNIIPDLPAPPPPPLHPGTHEPVGPDDLAPLFPMELILQEVSTERYIPIPERGAGHLPALAAVAALPGAPAGGGARHAGPDLLQVRGRLAGRLAQAEHRRAAGLLQRQGRHQEADHRNRRRANGAPRWPSPVRCSGSTARSGRSAPPTTPSRTGAR